MKKKTSRVSLRDIADVAGVSTFSVSRALQNKPGVTTARREHILRVAQKLGYVPNARVTNAMTEVRSANSSDLLPIAWLSTSPEENAWHNYTFMSPYLEGAQERARQLGYRLEEIWGVDPRISMRRLARILYERGVEGAIVTFPGKHFRLQWDHLASVALGTTLLAPRLHQVGSDLNFNLHLTLKSLKRQGYRRIGICLARELDSASHYTIEATARDLYHGTPAKERIPPLFHAYKSRSDKFTETVAWLQRYKPEVIIGHNNLLEEWVKAAGFRVPDDIGIVHLAVDDDVLDWAGIHSRRHETGAIAIEQVVSLMRNRQFGVPKTPLSILVRGTWHPGRTLKTARSR